MHWLFVLYSRKLKTYHLDSAQDMDTRIEEHNLGKLAPTAHGTPWEVVHKEFFPSWTEAAVKEQQIKSIGLQRYLRSIGK